MKGKKGMQEKEDKTGNAFSSFEDIIFGSASWLLSTGAPLLCVIFVELWRKVSLHVAWIPFFVLDSEPFLSTYSYTMVFVLALILLIPFLLFVFWVRLMPRGEKRSKASARLRNIAAYSSIALFWLAAVVCALLAVFYRVPAMESGLFYQNEKYIIYKGYFTDGAHSGATFFQVQPNSKEGTTIYCMQKDMFFDICANSID